MKKIFILTILTFLLGACSSRDFERDYQVVDASHEKIPEWIVDAQVWAEDEDEDDYAKNRYFNYTSEAMTRRGIACELAKAKGASVIASEITQFIKDSFSKNTTGDPRNTDEGLSEYVDHTLTKEVQSYVVGAQIFKTYWEKRRFKKEMGAPKDWDGYTCSVLIKITKNQLKTAFKRAENKLKEKTNAQNRVKVEEALKRAEEIVN